MVLAGRRRVAHSGRHYWRSAWAIWNWGYLSSGWCELATKVMRFKPAKLFFWVFFLSQIYANIPQTTDALKANITQAVTQFQPGQWRRVNENWATRIRATVGKPKRAFEWCHLPYLKAHMDLLNKEIFWLNSHTAFFISLQNLSVLNEKPFSNFIYILTSRRFIFLPGRTSAGWSLPRYRGHSILIKQFYHRPCFNFYHIF